MHTNNHLEHTGKVLRMTESGTLCTYRLISPTDPTEETGLLPGEFVIFDINDVERVCIQDVDQVQAIGVQTSMTDPRWIKNKFNQNNYLEKQIDYDWAQETMPDGSPLFSAAGVVKYCGKCALEKWMKIENIGGGPARINVSFFKFKTV